MRCRRERGGRALTKQTKGLVRTWPVLQLVDHAKWPPRGSQMLLCRVCKPSFPRRDTPRRTFEPQRPLAVAPRAFLGRLHPRAGNNHFLALLGNAKGYSEVIPTE